MEFFCPSCGCSNKTNLVAGDAKRKVCHVCHKEFLADDNNRKLSFKNSVPEGSAALHVFYQEDAGPRFILLRERYFLFAIALIGLAALVSAAIYLWKY